MTYEQACYKNATARMMIRAADFMEACNYEVEEITPTKIVLIKRRQYPKLDRRHIYELCSGDGYRKGGYFRIIHPSFPMSCERCGIDLSQSCSGYNIECDDGEWGRCCVKCFKPGEKTGIYEWSWPDIEGIPGFVGSNAGTA
jgi:hypothetical protein